MCPWLLLCVSALPGWHRWHRHFPAASSQSWATADLPGANQHTHTHAHTIKHYLYVFPLSRPGNRLCVSLSRPGLSEPYDPGRAAQTVLLLFNYTTSVTRFLVITVRFSCLTRNYYLHMSLIWWFLGCVPLLCSWTDRWMDRKTDRLWTTLKPNSQHLESSHPPPAAQLSICHVFFISPHHPAALHMTKLVPVSAVIWPWMASLPDQNHSFSSLLLHLLIQTEEIQATNPGFEPQQTPQCSGTKKRALLPFKVGWPCFGL